MFPVFAVLFPVCSQLKHGKQSGLRWQIETVMLGNTFIEGSESGTSRGSVVV
jgi:hypothetical protein